MKVLIIYSGKGGVGKTTTTVNLAKNLVSKGNKVYIIDGDVNTSSVHILLGKNQDHSEQLRFNSIALESEGFVYIQDSMIKSFIATTIKDIKLYKPDYVLIDTPPSITDVHINLIDKLKVSGVLMVTQPNALSVEDVKKTSGFFTLNNLPIIGLVENMASEPFDDGTDTSKLGFDLLATIKLDRDIAQGKDLSVYDNVSKTIENIDDVILENKKKIALFDESVTESSIEASFSLHSSKRRGRPLDFLKFHNLSTWEYVRNKLLDLDDNVWNSVKSDAFLTENTSERVERVLKAFEDTDEAYFMIVKGNTFDVGTIFCSEIGQASLSLDEKSNYGLPRIRYQTKFGSITLFPHEVMPVSMSEVNDRLQNDSYIPLSDGRYMPPKPVLDELFNTFGDRVGMNNSWSDVYEKQMTRG